MTRLAMPHGGLAMSSASSRWRTATDTQLKPCNWSHLSLWHSMAKNVSDMGVTLKALGRSSVLVGRRRRVGRCGVGLGRDGANGQVAGAEDSPRVVLQPAGAGDGVVVEG